MKIARASLFVAVLAFTSSSFAQNSTHHHHAGEKLGTVSFPISCGPTTQSQFERGVALLYSFEYEAAANQFSEIATKDSTCAMVYWGQAMSLYHQLWARPSKSDLKRSPLSQVAMSLAPPLSDLGPGWEQTFMDVDSGGSRWDLYLELSERTSGIIGRTQYDPDLFDAVTVRRIIEDLQTLLQRIAVDPSQRLIGQAELFPL
jgi:hypothetical protein